MSAQPWVKVGGSWKKVFQFFERRAGVWVAAPLGYLKVLGIWKLVIGTQGFQSISSLLGTGQYILEFPTLTGGDMVYMEDNKVIAVPPYEGWLTGGEPKNCNIFDAATGTSVTQFQHPSKFHEGLQQYAGSPYVRVAHDTANRTLYAIVGNYIIKRDFNVTDVTPFPAWVSLGTFPFSAFGCWVFFAAGKLFLVDATGKIYTVNTTTGVQTQVGTTPAGDTLEGATAIVINADTVFVLSYRAKLVSGKVTTWGGQPYLFNPNTYAWTTGLEPTGFYHYKALWGTADSDRKLPSKYQFLPNGAKCAKLSPTRVMTVIDGFTPAGSDQTSAIIMDYQPRVYIYDLINDQWDADEYMPATKLLGSELPPNYSQVWMAETGLDNLVVMFTPYLTTGSFQYFKV